MIEWMNQLHEREFFISMVSIVSDKKDSNWPANPDGFYYEFMASGTYRVLHISKSAVAIEWNDIQILTGNEKSTTRFK